MGHARHARAAGRDSRTGPGLSEKYGLQRRAVRGGRFSSGPATVPPADAVRSSAKRRRMASPEIAMSSFFAFPPYAVRRLRRIGRGRGQGRAHLRSGARARVPAVPAPRGDRGVRRPTFAGTSIRPRAASSSGSPSATHVLVARPRRRYEGSSSPGNCWPMRSASASALRRGSSPSPLSSSIVTSPEV